MLGHLKFEWLKCILGFFWNLELLESWNYSILKSSLLGILESWGNHQEESWNLRIFESWKISQFESWNLELFKSSILHNIWKSWKLESLISWNLDKIPRYGLAVIRILRCEVWSSRFNNFTFIRIKAVRRSLAVRVSLNIQTPSVKNMDWSTRDPKCLQFGNKRLACFHLTWHDNVV